jgi:hypothetical protein
MEEFKKLIFNQTNNFYHKVIKCPSYKYFFIFTYYFHKKRLAVLIDCLLFNVQLLIFRAYSLNNIKKLK